MSTWLDLLANPKGLESVYGGEVPSLDNIEVHEIRLHLTALRVSFDLEAYPSNPPAKWRAQEANTVQIELAFSPVLDISVTGWGWNGRADLSLTREADTIAVRVDGPEIKLAATSEFVRVSEMSAYIHEGRLAT